jgi:hypothetical protein
MIYYFLFAYLAIGIFLNFIEPLKGQIWIAKMNAASDESVSKFKLFLFTCVIRIGVVLFYPIFLLRK